jgi:hypothetical protein
LQKRCIVVSLFSDLTVESIQPKQSASSTASLYKILSLPVSFFGYSNQISSFISKFVSSHFRQFCRSMKYLLSIFFISQFAANSSAIKLVGVDERMEAVATKTSLRQNPATQPE